MDLSIIIINWKSVEYLRSCLKSYYANATASQVEIIVVDNASYDGCGEMLGREFPEVIFIQSVQNSGFAKSNNMAANRAKGRALLFLNPDTEIKGNAIDVMMDRLWRIPAAGAVGAKLLNSDLSIQSSCVRSFPTIANQVLDSELLRRLFPKSSLWGNYVLFDPRVTDAEVDALSGACFMIKRNLFESIGGFTEDYFMYAEDTDLSYKIVHAGFKNYYVAEACLIHHGGCSSKEKPSSFQDITRRDSVCKFLKKTKGRIYASLYRMSIGVAGIMRLCILGSACLLPAAKQKGRSSAFMRWCDIVRWSLGCH